MRRYSTVGKALFVTCLLPCLAACSDDTSSAAGSGGGGTGTGTGTGGDGGTGGGPDPAPAYAITIQVLGAEATDNQSYVVVTDTLDSDTRLSAKNGIEVAGRALGIGLEGGGAVFVAGDADATVTRYDLQKDGSLKAGATVSFQGKGVAKIGEYGAQFQVVSETKAYFFDGPTAQVVIWNPKEMTVTGSIPLGDLVVPDTILSFSTAPLRRGADLINFPAWRSGLQIPNKAAVVVVNSETDETTVVTDDRCGFLRDGVEGPDGKIYLATEAFGSAVHRLNAENAPAPCMLRFDPATKAFDPAFQVDLNTLFGDSTAGTLVGGPGNKAYLRVLDESVFEVQTDTNPRVLASAPAWTWASVTLGDTPTVEALAVGPSSGSLVMLFVGDRTFGLQFPQGESTNFLEIGEEGPGKVPLSAEGLVFSAVKLR